MKLKPGVPDGERGGHRRYRLTGPVWKTGVVRESKGREMEREADLRRLGEFDGGCRRLRAVRWGWNGSGFVLGMPSGGVYGLWRDWSRSGEF